MLLNTALVVLKFSNFSSGALSIACISLSSQNISSVQSFFGLFIASVTQSLYNTIISSGSNFNSLSLIILLISFVIHSATQSDFILKHFFLSFL
jgi:hypothetical protein